MPQQQRVSFTKEEHLELKKHVDALVQLVIAYINIFDVSERLLPNVLPSVMGIVFCALSAEESRDPVYKELLTMLDASVKQNTALEDKFSVVLSTSRMTEILSDMFAHVKQIDADFTNHPVTH